MTNPSHPGRRFRSQDWFDNPDHIDLTALYLERFMNYGITPAEPYACNVCASSSRHT